VRSVDPSHARAVRVLVAEAAEPPVPLSGILEAAGLRVVGRAATPAELERLLPVTRPEVVVFDWEMSAETVATTRSSEPTVGIVLVWPEGAMAGPANEHVSPARVRRDLAAAVRRAAPLLGVRSAPTPPHPMQAAPAPSDARSEKRRRGGVELLVAAVLTFLLVLSSIIFRITEGGGGRILAVGPAASLLPLPSGTPSDEGVAPPEAPSNLSTETATFSVNARVASLLPVDGAGSGGGGNGGGGNGGGGNGGGSGGGNGGGGGGNGGGGGGNGGGGGGGGGGVDYRAAACNAAVDVDVASSVLSHAISQVLANCLNNTKATGLPFALTHLAANAQRKAEHDARRTESGHGTHGAAGPGTAHGGSNDHGPGADQGRSSEHGHRADHAWSSGHGNQSA
jgi:hypothetical protein